MPQPVQPPETPAIIQSVTAEDAPPLDKSSSGKLESVQTRTLPTGVLATPTPPENFAPESSSLLTAAKSAALLGPPISVGYSLQRTPVATQELQVSKLNVVSDSVAGRDSAQVGRSPSSNLQPSNLQPSNLTLEDSLPLRYQPSTFGTLNVKRLVTQERGGEVREFEFTVPTPATQPLPDEKVAPPPATGEAAPQPPASPGSETTVPITPVTTGGVIELTADRQEYDEQQKVITAQGNVMLRFREALVDADRVQVNLQNRLLVAEGNVALTRGRQVLRGQRFEYYFVQDSGVILNATGELYTPTSGTDLTLSPPPDGSATPGPQRPLSDRITSDQPLQGISNPGAYSFGLGAGRESRNVATPQTGGTLTQLRYTADRVDFEGPGAIASNVRITNDPFSPPELELRADTARFTRVNPLVDEIVATRPRLVFDQGLEVPTFRNRITIDRRPREPSLVNFGYDGEDRGGLFVERTFEVLNTPAVRFSVTPQYFIQRAIFDEGIINSSVFGVRAKLEGTLGPRTTFSGRGVLTTLDPNDIEDELRASLRLQQVIGTRLPHTLNLEYSYRDRLFNGSLGFQTVQSSLGAVLTSPVIPLGKTGINLTYQAGAQYINADTDRLDLLKPVRTNNRVSLGRYQATASLSRGFLLWQGQALSPTPRQGLRYTPTPVTPYLAITTSVTGVASAYSSGDSQETLSGTIGLVGQLGHFSRPYLDYTGFDISYTQVAFNNLSPFLFDRTADTKVLSGGITQQIYGPFRIGFQTALNLDTGEEISTDYLLEYSRRTYNILLRYNPVQQIGSFSLRINDFNWTGNPGDFDNSDVRPVVQGVTR